MFIFDQKNKKTKTKKTGFLSVATPTAGRLITVIDKTDVKVHFGAVLAPNIFVCFMYTSRFLYSSLIFRVALQVLSLSLIQS